MTSRRNPERLKFILDLQACQCVSRYRGIGRYSLAFAQAFVGVAADHDVYVMLNGMFPEATADLSTVFQPLLPPDRILAWQETGPTAECDPANRERRERAERSRERFLASLSPDFVHVSSLFEGFPDSAITSVGACGAGPATAATVYDLIPLVHRQHYLGDDPNTPIAQYYFRKLEYVRRADLRFAISEATRQEAIEYLQLDPDTVVNISTAADPMFRPAAPGELDGRDMLARAGLKKPFAMYTGGPDRRKNIDGLIKAWAQLPLGVREGHQLAVICSLSAGHRQSLATLATDCGMAADELILPGFVSDADLVRLYNLAKAFVFPSWHEGFGLPVLEAMACGTAVIAANTSSLPEVVGRDDALFDPMNGSAIASLLARVLTDEGFRADLREHGPRRARMFSWSATARRALDAFESFGHPGISSAEPAACHMPA
jgi:glycosyltransferase involved in cell wall biosynthesis